MTLPPARGLFLDGVFALFHPPPTVGGGVVVYLPPFGEEMNRARRSIFLLGRALAAGGIGLLALDPRGTGDSAGDETAQRWPVWREDVAAAALWLETAGHPLLGLMGLRLGAALAVDMANPLAAKRLVLWEPLLSGQAQLAHLLRLRTIARRLRGERAEPAASLEARLLAGEDLVISGSVLTAAFASDLRRLAPPLPKTCPIHLFRSREESGEGAGGVEEEAQVTVDRFPAPAFWMLEGKQAAPELIARTTALWSVS